MENVILEAIKKITDPTIIVLLTIIFFLMKLILKREEIICSMTVELRKNGLNLAKLIELIHILVYGRNKK